MLALASIGVLAGALLAQRFKVFVLAPATLIAMLAAAAAGIAYGEGIASILLGAALTAIGLQLGYLAGAGLQFAIQSTRQRRRFAGVASNGEIRIPKAY